MKETGINIIETYELYEVGSLALVGNHLNRKLAPNIDNGGNVHLNVHEPGACSGNHYHEKVQEFFINPGPGKFLLHLRHPQTGLVEVIEMTPASLSEIKAYRAKLGVSHLIENPESYRATLIIIVDKDSPNDIVPADVYDE